MRTSISISAAVAAMICAAGVARATTAPPSRSVLVSAVRDYLENHGDLCVGKYTWPRYVTEADRRADSNDAVQLPVLERLGLVESTIVRSTGGLLKTGSGPAEPSAGDGEVERYSLTAKGRRFYLHKKGRIVGAHDQPVERDADLCVAHLSLDRIVKWTPPEQVNDHIETMVRYTYHIKSADWMADPEARKVFPIVDRIIRGQGDLLMSVTVQLRDGKWVPVLPGQ